MKKRIITINELETIIKEVYGYKYISIETARTGTRIDNMQYLDLGPGATLDIGISISTDKNDKEREIIILKGRMRSLEQLMESQYDWIGDFSDSLKEMRKVLEEMQNK